MFETVVILVFNSEMYQNNIFKKILFLTSIY
jgi:hypothetical protein